MTMTMTLRPRLAPWLWMGSLVTMVLMLVAISPARTISDPNLARLAQEAIEQSRYLAFQDTPTSYAFANPAQGLHSQFTAQGLRVTSLTHPTDWTWRLRLEKYGNQVLPLAQPKGQQNRVSYPRGPVTEWYANTAEGIEQGFTLMAPPKDGPVRLSLRVDGDLHPMGSGADLTFANRQGEAMLRYSKLAVFDRNGVRLPAQMRLVGSTLNITVDAPTTVYPILVDPLVTSVKKLIPFGGFDFNQYGYTVAVDSTTAVVGAPYDPRSINAGYTLPSAVFVFIKDRQGNWSQQARLTGDRVVALDFFGSALALTGNSLAVGAYGDNNRTGAVFIFERNFDSSGNVTWAQQAKIVALDRAEFDRFGYALDLDSNTLAVGAYRSDPNGSFSGSGYVFLRTYDAVSKTYVWSQQAKLVASDASQYDYFGYSIALHKDTVVVGAYTHASSKGKAYIFVRNGTTWLQQATLTAGDGLAGDSFGYSVDINGNTAVIGAYTAQSYRGKAYAFVRNGTTWTQQAVLTASDGTNTSAGGDEFGISVAINANTIVVGAQGASNKVGAAYVYKRDTTTNTWTEDSKLQPGDIQYDPLTSLPQTMGFGYVVAIDGKNNILVGSPGYNLYVNVGWAYIF